LEFAHQFIFVGGLLLALSILAGTLSSRANSPILLAFLGMGLFFGEDGPGDISFSDTKLSYLVCSAALAIILFDGGLHTQWRQFRIGVRPALSLATLGVAITAFLVALPLCLFMHVGFLSALLIGATVASTDAAAVFTLLHQHSIGIRQRLVAVLETESGLNDPMAVFLTVSVVELMGPVSAGANWLSLIALFVQQMGVGLAAGLGGGKLMNVFLRRLYFLPSGLYPILGLAGTLLVFGGAAVLHGSGFLAVYVAGLIVGNRVHRARRLMSDFMDGMAWLSQMVMLLILGLLVTPSDMAPDLPLAVLAAASLIFLARPIAVFVSLARSRLSSREKAFVSWVGLRGAVPIYLALIPALSGDPDGSVYFNVAFAIVLMSLVLQGWTIRPAARLCGLEDGRTVRKARASASRPKPEG
jgi:cell volume regulation protein A